MYKILAFIPKSHGDTNISLDLFKLGAMHVFMESGNTIYYNEFHAISNSEDATVNIVNKVNELGGVIKVGDTYYSEFHAPSHLEIAEADGVLNSSDGIYINE